MDPRLYQAIVSGDDTSFDSFSSNALLKETPEKNSVLHVAVLHSKRHIVEKILQSHNRSLLYRKNTDGDTALHLAARIGCQDIAKLLIDYETTIGDGIAVVSGQKLVLRLIHANGFEENDPKLTEIVNLDKDSALHDAVKNGHLSIVELLIRNDCELALLTNSVGESPFFLAVERKLFNIAKYLLDHAEQCSLAGRDGMNALHAVVVYLNKDTDSKGNDSKLNGEDAATNCNDSDLLGLAKDMVNKYPSASEEQDNLGWTPLHYAAHYGVEEVIELFLTNDKSSAYKKDKAGISAFHIATKKGEIKIMEMLWTICPDVFELLSFNGQTALHFAVKGGNVNGVEYLLRTSSSDSLLNKQDKDGNTPLHLAAILEDYEMIVMLLNDCRVKVNAVNKEGLTAMDVAQSCKELKEPQKLDIISKLKRKGDFPSLKRQLTEKNTEVLQYMETIMGEPQPQSEKNKENKPEEEKKHEGISQLFNLLVHPSYAKRAAEIDLLLATLIATVTFAAAFQVPGGYESDGPYKGLPILRNKTLFTVFIIFDSLAFGLSSSSIFLQFLGSMGPKSDHVNYALRNAQLTTFYSILAMVATFISAIHLVSGNTEGVKAAVYVCTAAFLSGFFYTGLENWAHNPSP